MEEVINDNLIEQTKPIRSYGWKRSLPSLNPPVQLTSPNWPKQLTLQNLPRVKDQGVLGSCTGNALASAFEFEMIKVKKDPFEPSRLFIYYNERALEGNVGIDSGAYIQDGVKSLTDKGVCRESIWPYIVDRFTQQPSKRAYANAKLHRITSNRKLPNTIQGFKTGLNLGYMVAFGFTVFEHFESESVSKNGFLHLPGPDEKPLGGHCVVAIGYDDNLERDGYKGFLIIRNSWGPEWGHEGNFYMPYQYIKNGLVDDLVIVSLC
jgi:C1A family cysteine protease